MTTNNNKLYELYDYLTYAPSNHKELVLFHNLQITFAFTTALLFSSWFAGYGWYILYIFVYEILYAIITKMKAPFWTLEMRIMVIMVSFLGLFVGRQFLYISGQLKMIVASRIKSNIDKELKEKLNIK